MMHDLKCICAGLLVMSVSIGFWVGLIAIMWFFPGVLLSIICGIAGLVVLIGVLAFAHDIGHNWLGPKRVPSHTERHMSDDEIYEDVK